MSDFENVAAFPLCWPEGWPRTSRDKRQTAKFADWTVFTATEKLREELDLLRVQTLIISSSIPLRKDGLPLSRPPVDGDPGIAVYFTKNKRSQCIAIDRYTTCEDNIRAITNTIAAMRTIERHGGAEILDRAFTGFAALPARSPWWEVLGLTKDASPGVVAATYRDLVKMNDPDLGGSHDRMAAINQAFEESKKR